MQRTELELSELRDPYRTFRVLGDEDAARLELPACVTPLLPPGFRLEARGFRDLDLELLPQLPQDRLVGDGRAADGYGFVSHPTSR